MIRLVRTERPYGDKREEAKTSVKFDGQKFTITAKDFWEGPTTPEEEGYWNRGYILD